MDNLNDPQLDKIFLSLPPSKPSHLKKFKTLGRIGLLVINDTIKKLGNYNSPYSKLIWSGLSLILITIVIFENYTVIKISEHQNTPVIQNTIQQKTPFVTDYAPQTKFTDQNILKEIENISINNYPKKNSNSNNVASELTKITDNAKVENKLNNQPAGSIATKDIILPDPNPPATLAPITNQKTYIVTITSFNLAEPNQENETITKAYNQNQQCHSSLSKIKNSYHQNSSLDFDQTLQNLINQAITNFNKAKVMYNNGTYEESIQTANICLNEINQITNYK